MTQARLTIHKPFLICKSQITNEFENKCLCIPKSVLHNLPNAVTLNTVSHAVVTPNHRLFLLLLPNCNFATAMNHSVNLCAFLRS